MQRINLRNRTITIYTCNSCAKSFKTKKELDKHISIHVDMQIHTREKPFKCNQSDHTREKPWKCYQCKNTGEDDYETLVRIHTGEKPGRCYYCGKEVTINDDYSHVDMCIEKSIMEQDYDVNEISEDEDTSQDFQIQDFLDRLLEVKEFKIPEINLENYVERIEYDLIVSLNEKSSLIINEKDIEINLLKDRIFRLAEKEIEQESNELEINNDIILEEKNKEIDILNKKNCLQK